MKILLICSKNDQASVNFFETLTSKNFNFRKIKENHWILDNIDLILIEKTHLYIEEKDIFSYLKEKDTQLIFLSKHSTLSEQKPRTISAHAVGNWNTAEYGGKNETLVKTNPIIIRELLFNLHHNKPKNIKYEVKQEATHHGPYLEYSTFFVEIGSDVNAWNDKIVCEYVCKELINYLSNEHLDKKEYKKAVGFGGSHYCTKFNKYTFDKNNMFCFGHIIPEYAIKNTTNEKLKLLLEQAKEKSQAEIILDENLNEIKI